MVALDEEVEKGTSAILLYFLSSFRKFCLVKIVKSRP